MFVRDVDDEHIEKRWLDVVRGGSSSFYTGDRSPANSLQRNVDILLSAHTPAIDSAQLRGCIHGFLELIPEVKP